MIKAIIIEDDFHMKHEIHNLLLKNYSNNIIILSKNHTVKQAVLAIEQHKPNLIFLDINLPDGTGFDILSRCVYRAFEVIFITAYDNHAIKAIKAGALDYLTKPFDEKDFYVAVNKAIERINEKRSLTLNYEVSYDYYKNNKKIILNTSENIFALEENDILYCKSAGNYTTFFTTNSNSIIVSKYIKKFEEILSEDIFIRCHRSFIVNKNQVQKYNKLGHFVLKNGEKVPVSKERKEYSISRVFS
ncbi:MAG: LytR/AlgR family response regulator transcription factor [Saprospiraceae bacterium]